MEVPDEVREGNKAIVRKYFDYFEKGKIGKIEKELWADNYKVHFPGKDEPLDKEGHKEIMKIYKTGFPDLKVTIIEQMSEEDMVLSRLLIKGTHKGEFKGIPPTNKVVRVTGITIHKVIANKIVEGWTEFDALGMMAQIGAGAILVHQE